MAELCFGCMKKAHEEDICPSCGFSKKAVQASPYLPLGTVLKDKYIVGKVLDSRADSARYIGYDKDNKTKVQIREFMPKGMFTRLEDSTVIAVNEDCETKFRKLEEKFSEVASKVANFKDSAAVVRVIDIFKDNNTSYTVSVFEEVIPFSEYIKRSGGSLEWDVARPLFMPLLSAMSSLSEKGVRHFAICPANIVVTPAGKARIINFAIDDVRKTGSSLSPQLFSGCSAPEQYEDNTQLDEATDVYGFTATLFFALTGNLPADAIKRKTDSRLLMSTNVVKRLPPHVVSALAGGLQVKKEDRIANFEDLRAQLSAAPTVQAIKEEIAKPVVPVNSDEPDEDTSKSGNFRWGVIAMIIGLVVFSVAGYFWYSQKPFEGLFDGSTDTTSAEEQSNPADIMDDNYTYPADSEYFRVPDFIGKTVEDAQTEAKNNANQEFKVVLAIDKEFSDTVPEGQICRQIPEQKKTVVRGHDGVTITVVVSKGQQYRELPDIEKMEKNKASEEIRKQGFIVNSTLGYSDDVPEGYVISYVGNVKAGDKIEYGKTVTINISLGPEPSEPKEEEFDYTGSETA